MAVYSKIMKCILPIPCSFLSLRACVFGIINQATMRGNILNILTSLIISSGQDWFCFLIRQNFRAGMALRNRYVHNLLLSNWEGGHQRVVCLARGQKDSNRTKSQTSTHSNVTLRCLGHSSGSWSHSFLFFY